MRILHVVRGLANSSGTTHIVGPLAEAQARQGHAVSVFYVEKPGRPAVTPDRTLVESQGFRMNLPTEHLGWSTAFARAVARKLRTVDAVHVHAIWNFPTWHTMRSAATAGVPYVVAPQGSLEEWALGRSRYAKVIYAALAEKPYFDRAAAIQALTTNEAEQCRRFGIRAPVRVLPNGIDLRSADRIASSSALRQELGLPPDSDLVLFLSRLVPKKGLDLLLPAFARILTTHPRAVLLIAGHDAGSGYRRILEQLITQGGIWNSVRVLGEVVGSRKFAVLRAADVFVLSSYSEGLPVAVLEAMACERPVVITPGCNLPDVAIEEAGWVVNAEVDALAAGLSAALLSEDERRRRGANGRRLVAARYTWDHIAHESISLYQSRPSR